MPAELPADRYILAIDGGAALWCKDCDEDDQPDFAWVGKRLPVNRLARAIEEHEAAQHGANGAAQDWSECRTAWDEPSA